MIICDQCRSRVNTSDPYEWSGTFPVYAVLGGLVGVFAASVGALWLAPITVVGGGLFDAVKCHLCNKQIKPDEPRYQVSIEFMDDLGRTRLRPAQANEVEMSDTRLANEPIFPEKDDDLIFPDIDGKLDEANLDVQTSDDLIDDDFDIGGWEGDLGDFGDDFGDAGDNM